MKLPKILLCMAVAAVSQANEENEDVGGYLFFGGEVSAKVGQGHSRIVDVDKKFIWVERGDGKKKVSWRSPCRLTTELILSDQFIDILEYDENFASMMTSKRESNAVSTQNFMDFQTQLAIAEIKGFGNFGGGEELTDEQQSEIRELENTNQDFQQSMQDALDLGEFERDGFSDTIYVKMEMMPHQNISNAYAAVVVSTLVDDPDRPNEDVYVPHTFVRARYIGDLHAMEPADIKLHVGDLPEFKEDETKIYVHLFNEHGDQVAMSNSRNLKKLTVAETRTFRELSNDN